MTGAFLPWLLKPGIMKRVLKEVLQMKQAATGELVPGRNQPSIGRLIVEGGVLALEIVARAPQDSKTPPSPAHRCA